MNIEFLSVGDAGRKDAENHIRAVYKKAYGANVTEFAPVLVTARRAGGEILCTAGIRTAQDGFFSDCYLERGFPHALKTRAGLDIPADKIVEAVSLASCTPFPVLPLMDAMIEWGRKKGMTCGVFTATRPLRRLLKRASLTFTELAPADVTKTAHPNAWGSYYASDPWVCAFTEQAHAPILLSPRARRLEAV